MSNRDLVRNIQFLGQQVSRLANVLESTRSAPAQLGLPQPTPAIDKLIDVLAKSVIAKQITDDEITLALRDLVQIFKVRNLPSE